MEDTGLKVVEDHEDDDDTPEEGTNMVTQVLGKIRSDAEVDGEPLGNSTRWIFDVDQCSPEIRVQLAFKYTKPKGELLRSYSLAPLSPGFWGAKVWLEEEVDEEGNETLVLHANIARGLGLMACKYRVAIDTIHTSTR